MREKGSIESDSEADDEQPIISISVYEMEKDLKRKEPTFSQKVDEIINILQQALGSVLNAKFDLKDEDELLNDLDEIQASVRLAYSLASDLKSAMSV